MLESIKCFIGKSEEAVVENLKEDKQLYRISKRDGTSSMMTMDYDESRMNLEIEAGIVVNICFY